MLDLIVVYNIKVNLPFILKLWENFVIAVEYIDSKYKRLFFLYS